MGKRGKLNFTSRFFFLKPNFINGGRDTTHSSSSSSSSSSTSSWAWPSCRQAPRTDSFRSGPAPTTNIFNSIYFDSFGSSSDHPDDDSLFDVESDETLIRGLGLVRSDRLLFEPGGHRTSSILPRTNEDALGLGCCCCCCSNEDDDVDALVPFEESVAVAVESSDPYGDFRRSMEEMVVMMMRRRRGRGGEGSWEWLEELLLWYLRVNGEKNHGYIVDAFVALLLNLDADHSNDDEIKDDDDAVVASCSNSSMLSSVSFEIEDAMGVDTN